MHRSSAPEAPDPALEAAKARAQRDDAADEAAEAKAAFHLRMRARGLQDLAVLRAFEWVPRQTFVPHRYLDLAARDLALPIGCGQTLDEPWLTGRMIEALAVERPHRVLQVGAGSGYATAILSHLAAEVIGLERYQSLASAAQARLVDLGIENAAIVWGDGLAVPAEIGAFDRILVHGLLPNGPVALAGRLAADGLLVSALPRPGGQAIVAVRTTEGGLVESEVCACRMQAIVPGLAAMAC